MSSRAIALAALGAGVLYAMTAKGKARKVCPSNGAFAGLTYSELVVGGADSRDPLPLVIGFHGLGSRGSNVTNALKDLPGPARIIAPDGPLPYGKNRAWWTHRSVTPDQYALETDMRAAARQAKDFVDEAARCLPSVGKPIIVGHSQGGMMSAALASLYPSLGWYVAAESWLPSGLQNPNIGHIVFIHGTDDDTVPFARTRDMVASLDSPNVTWIEVPGGAHGFADSRPQILAVTQSDVEHAS